MLYALIAVAFVGVSFLFSMLGLGGALVYVPVLTWAGFPVKEVAIPLALLLNGLTTLIALASYVQARLVDWKGGLGMTAGAFVFAPVGAFASRFVSVRLLLGLFAVAVLVAAFRMLVMSGRPEPKDLMSLRRRLVIGAAVGIFAGFVAGLLGVGGGFIMSPLLMWMGYETKKAVATSALAVTFSSFSGFAGHVAQGHFNVTLTAILAFAVLVGAFAGSRFMVRKAKSSRVKQVFAIVLFGIAAKLLFGIL
ncbi:MAG TPA: sulfite exporter TauE/SafE family protein [Longimicrobiales bacterium]|nr:sulfite exporter TauE/SafE family protein [Longimicrobiales bacterium]